MKNKILSVSIIIFVFFTCMFSLVACGEPKHEHTHNYATLKYDNESHWFECECGEKNNRSVHNIINSECVCGYVLLHSHEYSSLKNNETEHWYECGCGDKSEIESHKGGVATCTQLAMCSVCNESYGKLKEHNYNILKNNETEHWYECVCGDKDNIENHKGGIATYTELAVCSVCNASYGKLKEPKTQARYSYEFFDAVSAIQSYKDDTEAEFSANATAVFELLGEYHRLFDTYYEYAGVNNIKTINKNAGIAPVKVDERLIDFLLYAKEIYILTEGKTNIAMGSVLKLWHDAREVSTVNPDLAYIPDAKALSEAALHCDINNLIIDVEACTVYISDPDMSIDIGTLGKSYATEKAAQMLIARGVTSYVLNIGGDIRTIGAKVTGDGWIAAITNPDKVSTEPFACKVKIKNTSLVTSGNYERYYVIDGVEYHHIIDPITLMPANYFSSVAIFTADSGLADAISKALFCMSYEDGLALVESVGGVEVIWICHDGTIKHTDGVQFVA